MSESREVFDKQAGEYAKFADESFSWKYIERPAIDSNISSLCDTDTRILDIGSGNGRVTRHLVELGASPQNVVGLDPSQEMINLAKESSPSISYVKGKALVLPFEDESFDLITSNMVLHMMDGEELSISLREIARVLYPHGTFFFQDTNPYQDPSNLQIGEWVNKESPWGENLSVFQHDYGELFVNIASEAGLVLGSLDYPAVLPEGKADDTREYERYSSKPFRICGTFVKQ